MTTTHPLRTLALLCLPLALLAACKDKTNNDTSTPGSGADGGDDEADDGGNGDGDGGGDGGTDDTGEAPTDLDGDGFDAVADGGEDCDDTDPAVFPGAEEVCNEQDDDCDGDIDEEPVDGTPHHADADGDGYGDPETAVVSCAVPEGRVEDASDCGDDSAWVYPGAAEICDGRQTDCDDSTWSSDAGTAHWLAAGETSWVDMAATLRSAGSEAVTEVSLDQAGTLHICGGTWPVALTVNADVSVVGGDGTDAVVLTGLDSATVVTVGTEGVTATLADLTLADGLGTHTLPVYPAWNTVGGNLSCTVASAVRLESVALAGGDADIGTAMGLYQCDAEVSDLRVVPPALERSDSFVEVIHAGLQLTDTVLTDLTLHDPLVVARGTASLEVSGLSITGLTMTDYQSPFVLETFEDLSASGTFMDLEITNSSFQDYGFLYLSGRGVSATMDGAVFSGNTGEEGLVAVLDNVETSLVASNLEVSDSVGDYSAGIVAYYGTVEISDSSFTDLEAEQGGAALYAEGESVVLDNVTFTDLVGTHEYSGAIYHDEGTITATDVSFSGSSPHDLFHWPTRSHYDFGSGPVDFSCDEEACE